MATADQIIDRLGGTSAVAKALGLTASVVSSWRGNNAIPPWRHEALMALASDDEPLTVADFPMAPRRRPESAAA